MFEPLYTAPEMRAAEERYPGYPATADQLMRRAGTALATYVQHAFPHARFVTAVCGYGANGGDGRVAADLLRSVGFGVTVVEPKPEEEEKDLKAPDVIIDALFGTGFTGRPRPWAEKLIGQINDSGVPVVSVDLPSGVDASTGEVQGAAIRATSTLTFHGLKVGLHVAPGRYHPGQVQIIDIGLQPGPTEHHLVTEEILPLVPRRQPSDNKYTAGSVLVVGGARGTTGAAALAARAAFRADAGYVAIAAPRESITVLETLVVEAVKRPLDEAFEAAERASALALGPGLGREDDRKELVRRLLLETNVPAVVDADALFGLEPFERKAPTVLTPHEGELARLIGRESSWVAGHRLAALEQAVRKFRCVVLLKGADTLVGAPDEDVLVRSVDAPGLATAGTGDVLTGITAAFLAKGMDARLAAAAAATAQGAAALLAPTQTGLTAGDVIDALPQALG